MGGKPGLIKYNADNKDFKRVHGSFRNYSQDHGYGSVKDVLWIGTGEGLISI